jgi:hypothetical protein
MSWRKRYTDGSSSSFLGADRKDIAGAVTYRAKADRYERRVETLEQIASKRGSALTLLWRMYDDRTLSKVSCLQLKQSRLTPGRPENVGGQVHCAV